MKRPLGETTIAPVRRSSPSTGRERSFWFAPATTLSSTSSAGVAPGSDDSAGPPRVTPLQATTNRDEASATNDHGLMKMQAPDKGGGGMHAVWPIDAGGRALIQAEAFLLNNRCN